MRRRSLVWIAAFLAFGLSACATLKPPRPERLDATKACAEWRWIGISRSGGSCPEIPGWTEHPLFARSTLSERPLGAYCPKDELAKGPDPELTRKLDRFCVYEAEKAKKWLGSEPSGPPASGELVRIDRDCAALSLSGKTQPAPEEWKPYYERFLAQAGVPERPFTIDNPYGVRLAFLDTQPTRGDVPAQCGRSPHGYSLAHLARQLVCSGESCAARVTTRLALPIVDFDGKSRKKTKIDTTHGGYMGLQSDLAQAIQEEVNDWRKDRQRGAERHLVLNLSLAWDGELFDGLDEEEIADMRAGTQAVYRALQYAAGFDDVLVLAAAGNQKADPCDNFGPLLPAAWERSSPPESCGEERREPPPLVYAVGGVGADGSRRLINARDGGMPRRAAYGESAVVPAPDDEHPTAMLTGSSVSTAVASSIAAVVWSSFPELSVKEIVEILDGSGKPLEYKADFWWSPNASLGAADRPLVHRLSLCSALQAACQRQGSTSDLCAVRCDRPEPEGVPSLSEPWVRDSCQPWLHSQPEKPPCLACGDPPPEP
jgi:Subtilase family